MSTHNKLDKICVVIVVCCLILTGLFIKGESLGITKIVDADAEQNSDSEYFTANDLDGDWDTSEATVITLTGDGAEISGNGAYTNDGNVVITNSGYYVVSGSLTDGYLSVDAYDSSKVFILLNGVEINCSDDACIRVEQADKVFLTLAEGSQNTLTSGSTYSDQALNDGTDGAIFAHDDLTINGSGSLTVNAEYKHGIAANDDLVITGGVITVTAAADGIHVNDSLRIKEASITVDAGDDGIHSDASLYFLDGTLLIEECYEGIEALTIDVCGGEITIYPKDDGFNANGNSDSQIGAGGMPTPPDMDSADSSGGMPTPPDMGSADSFGGMPTPPDMGSTGGNTDSKSSTASNDEETYINISGGTITIINETGNDADGLDSNGDIIISGGTIYVSLQGSGSNSAVDYGSESGGIAEISGGTIIACGASSMAEAFDSSSTQASLLYNTSTVSEAGTTLSIKDTEGNVLLSWEVPCSFSSALVSCPQMETGETYTVVIGENEETITLEEVSASYGDAQSSMFGGKMNWGSMQPRRGAPGENSSTGSTDTAAAPSDIPGMSQDGSTDSSTEQAPFDMSGMSRDGSTDASAEQSPSDMAQGGMAGGPLHQQEQSQEEEQADEAQSTAEPLDAGTWGILGGCTAVLLAGIAIGKFYKKH